jgi:hypothetical protein
MGISAHLSLAKIPSTTQVVDPSVLIRPLSQPDDHYSAICAGSSLPLRRPPQARHREPGFPPPALRLHRPTTRFSDTASFTPSASPVASAAAPCFGRPPPRADARVRRSGHSWPFIRHVAAAWARIAARSRCCFWVPRTTGRGRGLASPGRRRRDRQANWSRPSCIPGRGTRSTREGSRA